MKHPRSCGYSFIIEMMHTCMSGELIGVLIATYGHILIPMWAIVPIVILIYIKLESSNILRRGVAKEKSFQIIKILIFPGLLMLLQPVITHFKNYVANTVNLNNLLKCSPMYEDVCDSMVMVIMVEIIIILLIQEVVKSVLLFFIIIILPCLLISKLADYTNTYFRYMTSLSLIPVITIIVIFIGLAILSIAEPHFNENELQSGASVVLICIICLPLVSLFYSGKLLTWIQNTACKKLYDFIFHRNI